MMQKMSEVRDAMYDVKQPSSLRLPGFKTLAAVRWRMPSKIVSLTLKILVVACFSFLVSCCFAQSASASLDRDKILLGEQVTVELKAENINPQTTHLNGWFLLPDTGNHIEVVKRLPIDTIAVNGSLSYIQNIVLTSFDSGNWQLPPLFVLLQKNNEKKDSLFANKLTLQVLPVDVSNLQQYHPMKDIIDVEVKPDYLLITLIISLVIFSAIALYFIFFKKKQKQKPAAAPIVAAHTWFETAMEQLETLQKQNPPALLFYTKLDEICRTFLRNQLQIPALQLTSDELMLQLNNYMQGDERTLFYQLLRLMNAVKFAKYQPKDEQKITDINTAKKGIQNIYYHLQSNVPQYA